MREDIKNQEIYAFSPLYFNFSVCLYSKSISLGIIQMHFKELSLIIFIFTLKNLVRIY